MFVLDGETWPRRTTAMLSGDRDPGIGLRANSHFHRSHPRWEGNPPPPGSAGLIERSLAAHRPVLIVVEWEVTREVGFSVERYLSLFVRRDRGQDRWLLFLQCSVHRADRTR